MVFVCLFVLFSHSLTAYATDETSSFLGAECSISYYNPNISTFSVDVNGYTCDITYRDMNGDWQSFILAETIDLTDLEVYDDGESLYLQYYIKLPEVIERGNTVDVNLNINHSSGDLVYADYSHGRDFNQRFLNLTFNASETSSTLTNTRFTFYDLTSSEGGIKYLFFRFRFYPSEDSTSFTTSFNSVNITEVSEKGLLSSIIDWIKKIITGITELPSKIASSLKAFFDNIVNAVTSIGDLIKNAIVDLGNFLIDGIKGLFIPSEEDITNMKDKWDTLLSDRFGALYQVGTLISDYASAFTEQSKGTITFPSVTIPLAGAEFTFGGWEVQVVPDGFSVVFDVLKTITSILATILFVNGLKNRFDKILGGADDI